MEQEKICRKHASDKKLVSKIFKTQTSQYQKSNLILKWARTLTDSKVIQMSIYMKRRSILLIIREMYIKTTMRYHFTSEWLLLKEKDNKWKECRKGSFVHCRNTEIATVTMEIIMQISLKIKNRAISYDITILLLDTKYI